MHGRGRNILMFYGRFRPAKRKVENNGLLRLECSQLPIGDIAVVSRLVGLNESSLDGISTTTVDDSSLVSCLIEGVRAEPQIVAYHQQRAEICTNN